MDQGRTPVAAGPGVPQVLPLDPASDVAGSVVIGLGSTGAGGSGSGGGDRPGLPPRDLASGKATAVEEEEDAPRVDHVEQVEFVAPEGSSSHGPIMSRDLAEFVGEAALARLMEENPAVVAAVLAAREVRLRQIAHCDEEERLR